MKDKFFATLAELVALAKDFPPSAFDEAAPEETTKHKLIRPLLKSLGYDNGNIVPESRIVGDHVDYLVNGHLHHPHGDHCDDHGPVQLA